MMRSDASLRAHCRVPPLHACMLALSLITRAEDERKHCRLQVINGYMSLLSTRSMMRCSAHSEEQANVAGNDGDEKQDEEVSEGEDAGGDHDDMEGDGPHVQGRETTESDQGGGRRRGEASSGSSDDGQKRSRAAHESGKEHTESTTPLACAFFSSFFYAILRNAKTGYNFDNVRRWSRNKVCYWVHADDDVCTRTIMFARATHENRRSHVCGGEHQR